jgi:uncharacterized protein (TIGR01777 family)
MNILITGASGLIASALEKSLTKAGHTIYKMDRSQHSNAPFNWYPPGNIINYDESKDIHAVINLAGSNISDGRWTDKKKNEIYDSRIQSTQLLSDTLANLKSPPKIFISASAIGFYGDTADNEVNEQAPAGNDFLASVAKNWEHATTSAANTGIRTINIRTGIVLSTQGGALKQMLLPFKLGLGGIVGNGKQYMSWVSINEVTRIIEFILNTDSISGPVNMVAPEAATNYEFTKSLGKALNRPTLFPLPKIGVRLLFGEMGDALLLTSIRVTPEKLLSHGYKFTDHNLLDTFKSLIKNKTD